MWFGDHPTPFVLVESLNCTYLGEPMDDSPDSARPHFIDPETGLSQVLPVGDFAIWGLASSLHSSLRPFVLQCRFHPLRQGAEESGVWSMRGQWRGADGNTFMYMTSSNVIRVWDLGRDPRAPLSMLRSALKV
jgi:hypothetical protein